jgi:hypothetical protein
MPIFTFELTLRGNGDQKSYLENVVAELQQKGARILNIQSKVGKVSEPLTKVNVITISYEAPAPITCNQI